jgi:hypothetical protein
MTPATNWSPPSLISARAFRILLHIQLAFWRTTELAISTKPSWRFGHCTKGPGQASSGTTLAQVKLVVVKLVSVVVVLVVNVTLEKLVWVAHGPVVIVLTTVEEVITVKVEAPVTMVQVLVIVAVTVVVVDGHAKEVVVVVV